jgi:hypothetical protein
MKNLKTSAQPIIAVLLLALSGTAFATDGISCNGIVSLIGVHGTDRVMLRLSGMNAQVQICSLTQTMGASYPISPDQCKADYATLLTAFTLAANINVYFDNVATGTSCTTFAGWEIATARWVHLDQ